MKQSVIGSFFNVFLVNYSQFWSQLQMDHDM